MTGSKWLPNKLRIGSPGAKYPKMKVINVTHRITKISPMNLLTRNCSMVYPLTEKPCHGTNGTGVTSISYKPCRRTSLEVRRLRPRGPPWRSSYAGREMGENRNNAVPNLTQRTSCDDVQVFLLIGTGWY